MKTARLLVCVLFFPLLVSCAEQAGEPLTINLWHTYGGEIRPVIEELVDTFNATVGRKQGINVNIETVMEARVSDDTLLFAANHEPGAPDLPDISFVRSYMIPVLTQAGLLTDLETVFTGEELDGYVPEYLADGDYGGRHYLVPVSKGCDMLYVNSTLYDRFTADWFRRTGERFTMEDLNDMERMVYVAGKYLQYTDDLTPDIPGDGKAFYAPDTFFRYFYTFTAQLGADMFDVQKNVLDLQSEQFAYIYQLSLRAVLDGYTMPFSSYGTYYLMTGDVLMASTSSGEGVYITDRVSFLDNTYEECRFRALPLQVYHGGKKLSSRRGVSMGIFTSTPEREKAAALFLKWLTAPEQNLRICAESGYLPVMKKAYEEETLASIKFRRPLLKEAFDTALKMEKDYEIYLPPSINNFVEQRGKFDEETTAFAVRALREKAEGKTVDTGAVLRTLREQFGGAQ